MKRTFYFLLAVSLFLLTIIAGSFAQSQNASLADLARATKKKNANAPKTATVYDNDNLPKATSISVVGSNLPDQPKDSGQDATAAGKKTEPQLKAGQSSDDRKQALDALKARLDEQKSKISLLSRELDVMQREYQVKAAEFNGDVARRAQNPAGFEADDAKYKAQIADRQKALDDAKAKLTDMQDQARKAGAPNSITE